jgi:hypothetical protein
MCDHLALRLCKWCFARPWMQTVTSSSFWCSYPDPRWLEGLTVFWSYRYWTTIPKHLGILGWEWQATRPRSIVINQKAVATLVNLVSLLPIINVVDHPYFSHMTPRRIYWRKRPTNDTRRQAMKPRGKWCRNCGETDEWSPLAQALITRFLQTSRPSYILPSLSCISIYGFRKPWNIPCPIHKEAVVWTLLLLSINASIE